MIEINSCEVCGNQTLISVLDLGGHSLCDDLVLIGDNRVCKEYPIEIKILKVMKDEVQIMQLSEFN